LDPADNDRLEAALKALEPEFEVNLVYFEEHSPAEQIRIAARTDILLGLHGNGLTHLIWLPRQSLVIEMMLAGGA
jgi:capsular polysaccharide biosynthesis protein